MLDRLGEGEAGARIEAALAGLLHEDPVRAADARSGQGTREVGAPLAAAVASG